MKIRAAVAYKRGERKEAYKLWEKAAAGIKEHRAKKRSKNQAADEGTKTTD